MGSWQSVQLLNASPLKYCSPRPEITPTGTSFGELLRKHLHMLSQRQRCFRHEDDCEGRALPDSSAAALAENRHRENWQHAVWATFG